MGGAIVVFDLDGTLVAGDAFGEFLRRSSWRNPLRLLCLVLTAPVWVCTGLGRGGRARAELLVVASITLGRSPSALDAAFREFARDHVRRGRTDVALQRLARHREAGDEVVVATACAQPLARAVCRELGLGDVLLVASPFRHRRWAPPVAVAIRGELKVRALRRAGVRLPVAHAYTDDARDLPLLRQAQHAHLVRPRARDEARVRAELGDVEVLR